MTAEKTLSKIMAVPLYLAALLIPFFFLPFTSEWFEWNKHYLLGILVVLALLFWLARSLAAKSFSLFRAPTDLPLVAWWVFVLVATILSKDRIVSFFGQTNNVSWSFLALTFYLLFAVLIIWSMREEGAIKKLLMCLGLGLGISGLYFWLARFGVFGALNLPSWNLTSSLNTIFGIAMAMTTVLALGILLIPKLEKKTTIFWSVIGAISFLCVLTLGYRRIWIALAIGLFCLLMMSMARLHEVRYPVVSLVMAVFVLSLVFILLGAPNFLTFNAPTEITLSQSSSWQITYDTLKEGVGKFLFGSGPATFVYDFSAHRPASYNLSPTWTIRFSRPTSSFLEIFSETGLFGAVAFLLVILVGLGTTLQVWMKRGLGLKVRNMISRAKAAASGGEPAPGSEEMNGLFFAVSAVWLTLAIMSFMIAFGTVMWVLFFVLLALLVVLGQLMGATSVKNVVLSLRATPQFALATSFIYILIVTAVVVGGVFLGRFYGSEIYARAGILAARSQDFAKSENLLVKAANLNPYRASYPLLLSDVYLRHAATESRAGKPDANLIGKLVGGAINSSKRGTDLAPLSVASWEQLAKMYANAKVFAKDANQLAIESLNKAISLETTNPSFYLMRGSAYQFDKKMPEAKADYQKAIELKANYPLANYVLSFVLEGEKDLDGAVRAAEGAARYAPRDLGVRFNLGRLLYNRNGEGDWKRAEEIFKGNLTLNPNHANTLYAMGLLSERQNKLTEARDYYNQVLALDPSNKGVKERLDKLPVGTPTSVKPSPIEEEEVAPEEGGEGEAVVE